jgi:hypothetical protein
MTAVAKCAIASQCSNRRRRKWTPSPGVSSGPCVPFVGGDGVAVRVHPLSGSVPGVSGRVKFAAQSYALHESPGSVVVGEAGRHHPVQEQMRTSASTASVP